MERSNKALNLRPRWSLWLLAGGAALASAVACGSGDDNASPSTPVITTGGTGGAGGAGGKSGSGGATSSAGTSSSTGGTSSTGGSSAHGGSTAQGGTGAGNDVAGAGGEAGEAGSSTGGGKTCPTTDEGFLNQPSNSQKSVFDNTARLGAHDTLPPLPG